MPWYTVTLVISRPYSLVVSLTLTCECVDVCDMLEFLFDALLYALTDLTAYNTPVMAPFC